MPVIKFQLLKDLKNKVLIINYTQFGYHIDSWMYTLYADKNKLDIYYFCFDSGFEKICSKDVTLKYIPLYKDRFSSYLSFFLKLKKYLINEKFNLVFHVDAKFTLILRILNLFSPMVLDIRTGNLSDNTFNRFIGNTSIRISSLFYKNVSVITESLREELKISKRKATILPLGGVLHNFDNKSYETLRLLYTGTLEKRNIGQTIEGLALFHSRNQDIAISYDIIGFGKAETEREITDLISSLGMGKIVIFHGRKRHNEIIPFLEKCNVGVVYIPKKRYYEFQSSTKFYEYVLAGMPVIATNTFENRMTLKVGSGYICTDKPASFAEALERTYNGRERFDSVSIRSMYLSDQWEVIVKEKWEPFILENCR